MLNNGYKSLPRYFAGAGGILLSLFFLISQRGEPVVAIASIYFLLVCATDTFKSRIPNVLNIFLAATGISYNTFTVGGIGFFLSLIGLFSGILLLLLPYLMGGFGAGDVKALGALGSLIGPKPILNVFVYMAFCGGAMALLHYLFNSNLKQKAREWLTNFKASALTGDPRLLKPVKTETLRFPYAAAIAFGFYIYLIRGDVL